MKLFNYHITTIANYPDDDNHQQCNVQFPFCIRKGEDGYHYRDKNNIEKKYNLHKETKTGKWNPTKKWICHLKKDASESLQEIFEIKESVNLQIIIKYCTELYVKSLKMEIKRMKLELVDFN